MASVDELQDELVRQSSARLDAEHERTRLEEQVRRLLKETQTLRDETQALRDENGGLAQQVEVMQNEMADLSSSLVEEANVKVGEANRKVASAQRMVAERDTLLEIQASQLQEIKRMMARQEEAAPARSVPRRQRQPAYTGPLDADAVLDLDAYASPVRPLLRLDTREFREFCEIFPVEGAARSFHFSLEALEAPAWRRSRFVTRLIQEDIEPTLRLDRAAHMNWLTCRAFLNAVLDQTLILEPVSTKERPWAHRPSHPCLLCGENRAELIYSRYFWARTTPDAEPLVLDLACLAKVRLACELVGFVRSITDAKPGHTQEQQEQAWRECTSLREQLFWARSGGLYPESGDDADADADAGAGAGADGAGADPSGHELQRVPGDLSRVGTPQMAQSAFAVASPANTISSAVLRNAVPAPRGHAASHLSHEHAHEHSHEHAHEHNQEPTEEEHAVPSEDMAPAKDITQNSEEYNGRAEENTEHTKEHAAPAASAAPAEAVSSRSQVDLAGSADPESVSENEARASPLSSPAQHAASSRPTNTHTNLHTNTHTNKNKNEATNAATHTQTEYTTNTKFRGGNSAAATPDSEAEFHFDDAQEFPSPAAAPSAAPATSPRETMPGGWPG